MHKFNESNRGVHREVVWRSIWPDSIVLHQLVAHEASYLIAKMNVDLLPNMFRKTIFTAFEVVFTRWH